LFKDIFYKNLKKNQLKLMYSLIYILLLKI